MGSFFNVSTVGTSGQFAAAAFGLAWAAAVDMRTLATMTIAAQNTSSVV
jgi:hypothetical protein